MAMFLPDPGPLLRWDLRSLVSRFYVAAAERAPPLLSCYRYFWRGLRGLYL